MLWLCAGIHICVGIDTCASIHITCINRSTAQDRNGLLRLIIVQILPPCKGAFSSGAIEQEGNLTAGKLRFGSRNHSYEIFPGTYRPVRSHTALNLTAFQGCGAFQIETSHYRCLSFAYQSADRAICSGNLSGIIAVFHYFIIRQTAYASQAAFTGDCTCVTTVINITITGTSNNSSRSVTTYRTRINADLNCCHVALTQDTTNVAAARNGPAVGAVENSSVLDKACDTTGFVVASGNSGMIVAVLNHTVGIAHNAANIFRTNDSTAAGTAGNEGILSIAHQCAGIFISAEITAGHMDIPNLTGFHRTEHACFFHSRIRIIQTCYCESIAVKGAGIGLLHIANGDPNTELPLCQGAISIEKIVIYYDIRSQHRICRSIFYINKLSEPVQLAGVADVVNPIDQFRFHVYIAGGAESLFVTGMLRLRIQTHIIIGIDLAAALIITEINSGTAKNRIILLTLSIVQILAPGRIPLCGFTVQNPGHLTGGKLLIGSRHALSDFIVAIIPLYRCSDTVLDHPAAVLGAIRKIIASADYTVIDQACHTADIIFFA